MAINPGKTDDTKTYQNAICHKMRFTTDFFHALIGHLYTHHVKDNEILAVSNSTAELQFWTRQYQLDFSAVFLSFKFSDTPNSFINKVVEKKNIFIH